MRLIGREAMKMKWTMFGDDIRARGPWLNEKRRSLKMPSQTRKKEVNPTKLGLSESRDRRGRLSCTFLGNSPVQKSSKE